MRPKTSDFWETNLHHFLTITLLGGMIMQNFIRSGVIISFLHVMSDISTSGSRVLSHTTFKKTTVVSFIICTFWWIVFRNIFIPLMCYRSWQFLWYTHTELQEYNVAPIILNVFLSLMCLMHFYWTTMFIRMIRKNLGTVNTEDF